MGVAQNAVWIGPADGTQEPAIRALLARCGLPHADIGVHLQHFQVALEGEGLLGAVGAELYGPVGLLRSLAVSESARGRSLGRRLCAHMESYVKSQGVQALYLLTENAAGFFAKLGFTVIARDQAPDAIRETQEFVRLCPASAACMMKQVVS